MTTRAKVSATPLLAEASDEAAVRVLQQFRQIFNAVRAHFRSVERQVGLGGAQVWALSLIARHPDIGVGELARAMHIHQSTASNLVKPLIERQMVTAMKDDGDRRAVRLQVTAAGRRLLKRSPAPFEGVLPQALATLDKKALKRLEADLGRVIVHLRPDSRAAKIPLAQL